MLKKALLLLVMLALIAACQPTGDTASDTEAAGNYLPNIATYNRNETNDVNDALATVAGGTALLTGNPILAGAVAKLNDVINCYEDVGAIASAVYTPTQIIGSEIPAIGIVAVINNTRIESNFFQCLAGQRAGNGISAQSAELEPCTGSGNFIINNEQLSYIFAATNDALCATFEQHFENIRQNQGSG